MKVTGKECLNCGSIIFAEWGSKELLAHDATHFTGWAELQETKEASG